MTSKIVMPGQQARSPRANQFRLFAQAASKAAGTPAAFIIGLLLVIVWGLCGPIFHFSENWQLVINTGTTIITFLMVFVIQNTQARDSKELHLKLDELLRAVETARNTIIDCADLSDEELQELETDLKVRARRRTQEKATAKGIIQVD